MKKYLIILILINATAALMAQEKDTRKQNSVSNTSEYFKIHGLELGSSTWDWVKEHSTKFNIGGAEVKYFYSIKNSALEMPENSFSKIATFTINGESMQGVFHNDKLVEISSIIDGELFFEDKDGFIAATSSYFDKKYMKKTTYNMESEEYRFLGDAKYISWVDKKSNTDIIIKKIILNTSVCATVVAIRRSGGANTADLVYKCSTKTPSYSIAFRDNGGYAGLTKALEDLRREKIEHLNTNQKNKVLRLTN